MAADASMNQVRALTQQLDDDYQDLKNGDMTPEEAADIAQNRVATLQEMTETYGLLASSLTPEQARLYSDLLKNAKSSLEVFTKEIANQLGMESVSAPEPGAGGPGLSGGRGRRRKTSKAGRRHRKTKKAGRRRKTSRKH